MISSRSSSIENYHLCNKLKENFGVCGENCVHLLCPLASYKEEIVVLDVMRGLLQIISHWFKKDVKWDWLFVFFLRYKVKNFMDSFWLHQTSQLMLLIWFQSVPLTWGLCAPLACNVTEIRQLISTISKGMWINLALLAHLPSWNFITIMIFLLSYFQFHNMYMILIIKFSTSDNAFRVLWLVHSILVISSYTLVWSYMVNDCTKRC